MGKTGKFKKLTSSTKAHAIIRKYVTSYWKQYGSDISKWPSPLQVFEEVEDVMTPFGADRKQRLAKLRSTYNRMTKHIFLDNGKIFNLQLYIFFKLSFILVFDIQKVLRRQI